jgi:vancomycin resistance protein YoaR
MRSFLTIITLLITSTVSAQGAVELSTFSTTYRTTGVHRNRAHNVGLTVSKVDDTVIQPGDVFSYNAIVGERSEANGFLKAHVIREHRLVDDWGGGACQLASTLHAAALYAGIEITESHAHSLASAYMQASLDSTVSWPNLDLKIRNNTKGVITIRATAKDGNLTVILLSDRQSDREVLVKTRVLKKRKRPTWKLPSDKVKTGIAVLQGGSDGMVVERNITIKDSVTGEVYVNQTRRFRFEPLARILLIPKQE